MPEPKKQDTNFGSESEAFVYKWTDKLTGKLYIGSHKGTEDDGYVCSSKPMLAEYRERPEDFTREIISYGSISKMTKLETEILESVDARINPLYYNMHNGDGNFYNKGHSEETKRKISKANRGKVFSKEHIKNLSISHIGHKQNLGRICSEETKLKISNANKGKIPSEEHKRKLSEALIGSRHPFYGKTHTEESRKKISESKKGKGLSREIKQKISETLKGKPKTKETRQKMSDAQKGKTHSEMSRQKMSESKKGTVPWNKGKTGLTYGIKAKQD